MSCIRINKAIKTGSGFAFKHFNLYWGNSVVNSIYRTKSVVGELNIANRGPILGIVSKIVEIQNISCRNFAGIVKSYYKYAEPSGFVSKTYIVYALFDITSIFCYNLKISGCCEITTGDCLPFV